MKPSDPSWHKVALHFGTVTVSGEDVRRARRAERLSQQELAAQAGVSRRTIARIEASDDASSHESVLRVLRLGRYADEPRPRGPLLAEASATEILRELALRFGELHEANNRRPAGRTESAEDGRDDQEVAPPIDIAARKRREPRRFGDDPPTS